MADGGAMSAASGVPWTFIISILALAISFASLWNARQVRHEARKSRRSQLILSEFDRQIRTPAETTLAAIVSFRKRLELIPVTSRTRALSGIKQDANQQISDVHSDIQVLLDLLEQANRTRFTEGEDWQFVAQPHHDALLQAETVISAVTDFDATMTAITQAARALGGLETSVREHIDQELHEHIE